MVATNIFAAIVRNVHLRRELSNACAEPALNFWRLIYGNLTDAAVLEWCKLFGADDNEKQPVHWKSLVEDQDEFRNKLLASLNISRAEWDEYWKQLKAYRDHAVAHYDPRQAAITHYPHLISL